MIKLTSFSDSSLFHLSMYSWTIVVVCCPSLLLGFVPTATPDFHHSKLGLLRSVSSSSTTFLYASSSDSNSDEFSFDDIEKNLEDTYDESALSPRKLGINIGNQLSPEADLDLQALKEACKRMIDEKISNGLDELNKLHDKWQRDLEFQQEPLEQAMTLNGIRETKKFNERVDLLVGSFMNTTSASRERTHALALEDLRRLQAEEREKERKKKGGKTTFSSWKKTNDAWDEWDEDW